MPTPIPTPQATSRALDSISSTIGAVIVRGPLGWTAILPGPAGTVLTSNGPGALPSWEPLPP